MTAALLVLVTVVGVVAVPVWWLRRTRTVVTVSGHSMEPALAPGERVLVRRIGPAALRRGQIVVVEAPPYDRPRSRHGAGRQWLIKRVAALPGDTPDDHALGPAVPGGGSAVPPGRLAVLGDNLANSADSRVLGYLPIDRVLGTVVRRL